MEYEVLLRGSYDSEREKSYLSDGKDIKALSGKFQRNSVGQSELMESKRYWKNKLPVIWNGLKYFNLKGEGHQDHSLTKQKSLIQVRDIDPLLFLHLRESFSCFSCLVLLWDIS